MRPPPRQAAKSSADHPEYSHLCHQEPDHLTAPAAYGANHGKLVDPLLNGHAKGTQDQIQTGEQGPH
jgi:hypothetical protein